MDEFLNQAQGRELVRLARAALNERLGGPERPKKPADQALDNDGAAFVTLKKKGQLRGCIGNLAPVGSLWRGVVDNAINAAFHDHRFSPVRPEELADIVIDVSVLTPPRPLEYDAPGELLQKLRPGVDGVILGNGRQRATFLPQVWEQLRSPEEFLDHLCLKAGLPRDHWRQEVLEVQVYQVQSFSEGNK